MAGKGPHRSSSRRDRAKEIIYVSIDIETNGHFAGINAMLSVGAAAYSEDGKFLDSFSINLQPLPGTHPNPDTENFWRRNPEAYEATTRGAVPALFGIIRFQRWLEKFEDRRLVAIAWPAEYDLPFIRYYFAEVAGIKWPFDRTTYDIRTLASLVYNQPIRKKHLKRGEANGTVHTHIALEDALEQGQVFFSLRRALDASRRSE